MISAGREGSSMISAGRETRTERNYEQKGEVCRGGGGETSTRSSERATNCSET